MNRLALLAIIVCSSTMAAADDDMLSPGRDPLGEPNGYIAGGATVGKDHFTYEAFTLEAASRFQRSMLFGRLQGSAGNTTLDTAPGTGTFVEGRVGVEARSCTHAGMLCGSLGLDLGMHRNRFERQPLGQSKPAVTMPPDDQYDSAIAVPRLTIDGGARVRVRGVLEFPSQLRAEHGSETGIAFTFALGVGF